MLLGQARDHLAMAGVSVGGNDGSEMSWATVLSRSLAPSLNNNVLEVVLEKDTKGGFIVNDVECANLIKRLGIYIRPGVNVVEGVQVCPNVRGVIYLTLKKDLEIGRYCSHDVIDVTSTGI